jgi:hypothetical protein
MITSVAAPSRISQRQYAEDYQGENKAGGWKREQWEGKRQLRV